jgi:phage shock protein A
MMSFWRRIARIFNQKVNALLQRAEDPLEALDLIDSDYINDLGKIRRHIASVFAEEKRLQFELLRLGEQERKYERLSGEMLTTGDEPSAGTLLTRALHAREHRAQIESAYDSVCAQRKALEAMGEEMRSRLEALRVRRQTARAETIASRAVIAAREWMLPLSSAGVAREESLEHAHEALLRLRCRSQALSDIR